MSIDVMKWVWTHRHPQQTPIDRLVLLALADAGNDDGVTWTGVEGLMTKADASRSAVYESLKRLAATGQLRSWKEGRRTFHQVLMVPESVQNPDVQNLESVQDSESPSPESGNPPAPPYKENPKKSNPKRDVEPAARPDVEELCQKLADRIIANGGSAAKYRDKATKPAWTEPMRLLLDRDLAEHNGTAADRVAKAIDWCQADDFWRSVVLSPAKLREQYDALRLAAQRQHSSSGRGPSPAQQKSEREWKLELGRVKEERRKAELEALRSRRPA